MEAVQKCIHWGGGGAVWQNVGERRYTEKQKPKMVDEGSWGEAGSMEDNRRHYRQRGVTAYRLKAPVWPEDEGSQESGGQGTEEYGGRTVPKA